MKHRLALISPELAGVHTDLQQTSLAEAVMRYENIPSNPSPESPPLAPYDPPEPAPQAQVLAWRRALRVIGCVPDEGELRVVSGAVQRAMRHRC